MYIYILLFFFEIFMIWRNFISEYEFPGLEPGSNVLNNGSTENSEYPCKINRNEYIVYQNVTENQKWMTICGLKSWTPLLLTVSNWLVENVHHWITYYIFKCQMGISLLFAIWLHYMKKLTLINL